MFPGPIAKAVVYVYKCVNNSNQMGLFEEIHNVTNTVHDTMDHAETTIEIIGMVVLAAFLLCILSYVCRLLSLVRWIVCCANPYRRV